MTYKDKVKHGAASFIIFTVVAIITKNLVFSFIATYSLGIIKEIYDQIFDDQRFQLVHFAIFPITPPTCVLPF